MNLANSHTLANELRQHDGPPVYTLTLRQLHQFCQEHNLPFKPNLAGRYLREQNIPNYPPEFIILVKNHTPTMQLAALYHELGHAQCYEFCCPCQDNPDNTTSEIHAHLHTLKAATTKQQHDVVRLALQFLHGYLDEKTPPERQQHLAAITPLPEYQNALASLANLSRRERAQLNQLCKQEAKLTLLNVALWKTAAQCYNLRP